MDGRADEPLVSVIIPVFNAAPWIRETLDSVLAQSYRRTEILVVDDGSTDGSDSIVTSYGSRVAYLPQEHRGRPAAARNRGLARSAGELATFFDADDVMLPWKIESQVEALRRHAEAGVVVTDYLNFGEKGEHSPHFLSCGRLRPLLDGVAEGEALLLEPDTARNLLAHENFATSPMMVRREVLDELGGFDETLRGSEDFELVYRIATRYPVGVVKRVGFHRRLHGTNLSHDTRRVLEQMIGSRERALAREAHPAMRAGLRRSLLEARLALQHERSRMHVPYRVKAFVSDRLPLLYYLANKIRHRVNGPAYWNRELEQSWDDPKRTWPTKNALVASIVEPDDVVLDVGCGNGSTLRYLRAQGHSRLKGLDGSSVAVRRLSALGIEMQRSLLPRIDVPSASVDVLIASEVLEHLVRRKTFVREVVRVLKPGATAIITVPDDCMGPMDEKEHTRKYTRSSLAAFLGRYLDIVDITSISDENHVMPTLVCIARRRREPCAP